jgi:hypothetical protein
MIVISSIPEAGLAEALSGIAIAVAAINGSNARIIIEAFEFYSM